MRIIYNVRHRYAICLKFGGKLLTFLTKLVLEGKVSICSTIKASRIASRTLNLTKISEKLVKYIAEDYF